MTGNDERDRDAAHRRRPVNLVASISQRPLNLARESHEEFQSVLTRYALERLLFRLGDSPYKDQFVVKGAILFALWQGRPHRATRDLDLLGYGSSDLGRLEAVFRDLCRIGVEADGLTFMEDTVSCGSIREDQEYGGVRIHMLAMLGKARIPLQIDVGFGDAITPSPAEVVFPTLLDLPAPHVRAYPRETVVAEKFEAFARLGMANTRMKDFYYLWFLANQFAFNGALLSAAIRATFMRRGTPIPAETPIALSPTFYQDAAKQVQWRAFLHKGRLEPTAPLLADVATILRTFLLPAAQAASVPISFDLYWPPGGAWRSTRTDLGEAIHS